MGVRYWLDCYAIHECDGYMVLRFTLLFLLLLAPAIKAEEPVNFNRDVRPLLANHCFRCHGPDADTREADLRLDQPDSAYVELDSGERAIVPGHASSSELLRRITSADDDVRMPPSELGPGLEENEIALLETWIEQGAAYENHWSLEPIQRPSLRELPAASHPIDRFVLAKLSEAKLLPNEGADRGTLIRRVSLALTGLPPTIAEVEVFQSDPSTDAYERLVDRLLMSPRFGERWARIWLDIARYADSAGYAQDPARTIWRYRDWVIDAYNINKTFEQFTVEQIAGDLLPDPTVDQLLATAFHRNTMTNSEGGTDDEEFRNAAVVDRVNTTMQVWMGLTMGCAQCHDHKYDDISQEEYFRFFAIFNSTEDADKADESPWLEELSADQQHQRDELQAMLTHLQDGGESTKEERGKLQKQLDAVRGVRTPIMRELAKEKQRETFVQVRGNFRVKEQVVSRGVPAALHRIDGMPDRLQLANWLISSDNPLTARVVVNRYWELLFGAGLVPTSEDFGVQGELPSHPELLDYLAAELMRHDWDTKWLIKEIVTSATYRRSSKVSSHMATADGSNRWLARGPRFRMPAEMIRDQALAVSGLLSTKMHGPSVNPPRPKLGLRAAFGGSTDWETSEGEDRYRRGLYTSWRRTTPYPSLATFDAPSREFCTVRRIRTNTPLQALVTLNDPVFVEAAQALARRVLRTHQDWSSQCDLAFQLVVARKPVTSESARLKKLYDETVTKYQADLDAAAQMAYDPLGETAEFDVIELAAWTVVSNVLLNLDETLAPR